MRFFFSLLIIVWFNMKVKAQVKGDTTPISSHCDTNVSMPSAYSPNLESSIYDKFFPVFKNQKATEYELSIFDRNGKLIYQGKNQSWYGTDDKGHIVEEENYSWVLKYKYSVNDSTHSCYGTVYLIM